MITAQPTYQINLKYLAICLMAVFLTFFFHEGAHYVTGKLLGYEMWFSLNAVGLVEGQSYSEAWHNQLVAIAGPIVTVIQAIGFFYIIKKTKNMNWYPFLFIPALMRVFASFMSAFVNPNDEAAVSQWLGIGKLTLPIFFSLFLIFLVVEITKQYNITWKFNIATYLIMSLGISAIVFSNPYIIK